MEDADERQREIDQGLRTESGAVTGGLVVFDYVQGIEDHKTGATPPRLSSASYDLGRAAGRRQDDEAEAHKLMMAKLDATQARSQALVREMLADRPDLLAEFDAKMAALA